MTEGRWPARTYAEWLEWLQTDTTDDRVTFEQLAERARAGAHNADWLRLQNKPAPQRRGKRRYP